MSATVDESAATDHVVVTVAADDPDEDDTLTYSLAGDTAELAAFNAAFDFDTATGAVTVKAGSSLDYATKQSYEVTVQVTDNLDDKGESPTPPSTTLCRSPSRSTTSTPRTTKA